MKKEPWFNPCRLSEGERKNDRGWGGGLQINWGKKKFPLLSIHPVVGFPEGLRDASRKQKRLNKR